MAKFKISNYQGIKIDCWTAKDLVGLHHLMKQEGCPNSENLFSDTDKAISNYSFDNSFYVLLTKKAATPSNLNRLRRNVGNNPNYQFMDAVEFHKLFED